MLGTGRGRGGAKEGSSSLFLLRETNLVRRSVRGIACDPWTLIVTKPAHCSKIL